MEDRVEDRVPAYERPGITDYGTLLDLTLAGGEPNSDIPKGPANTAFSAG